jgi:dTDP-glucose pyrophosphorylase
MIALILAAGAAKRYGGNKVLTRYKNKSLIEWNILFAIKNGITDICITINELYGPEIIAEVKDVRKRHTFNFTFKYQDKTKYGPAAAILPWADTIKEDFLLLLGDNYYDGKITWGLRYYDCIATYMTFTESEDN